MAPCSLFRPIWQLLNPLIIELGKPEASPGLITTQPAIPPLVHALLFDHFLRSESSPQTRQPSDPSAPSSPNMREVWFLITPSEAEAEELHENLAFFHQLLGNSADQLVLFPQWGTVPFQPSLPPIDITSRRVCALQRLIGDEPSVLIASAPALLQKIPAPHTFRQNRVHLVRKANYERDPFIRSLLRLGYRRVSIVEVPGEFSVRGGILDVFSTAYVHPLRVEFLGDTIDSIRQFDPATQESVQTLHQAWVLPVHEYMPWNDPCPDSNVPAPLSREKENQVPELGSVFDYLREAPRITFVNPSALRQAALACWNLILEALDEPQPQGFSETRVSYGTSDDLYEDWEDLLGRLQHSPKLFIDSIAPSTEEGGHPLVSVPAQATSALGIGVRGRPFGETLDRLSQLRSDGPVFLVARSQGQVERLLSLLEDHGHPAVRWSEDWLRSASDGERLPFFCLYGDLSSGLVSHDGHIAFVTEEELFGKGIRHRPQPKTQAATFLSSLDDLHEGELVVHVNHGICRYQGLRRLSVQGYASDYLLLQFAGTDTLYVPLDRLNQIQRYRGADHHPPKLDRLGGASWAKTKTKVKKSIEEMAHELLELYANREVARRKVYSHDSMLMHEFEAAFEYEETPDQRKAIEDIQRDLESPKPMDRLVCGDVGYGKTEVAMRAAFKAVQDHRQVAVLVPTTLLAQQHYETFSLRFAPFPVRIGILSRFQNSSETKTILADVASGTLDIIIGTHRLLQKDVVFKNLGLVITDEEQWFGVRHKERLKQLRTQVDVLTLSATPIPRTLQLALSGVRDLSVIDTPPPGRLAIHTQVHRFDPSIIRDAIKRELSRGGQVYYVHNRVETMEQTGTWLQSLVPEAHIVMAHGQMDAALLEKVMLKFFHREADVLVASAIIQSGLDIPNANTILIDRADLFGLAQLYQLRGRVGRGGQQAYAFLFVPNEETLSTDAQKRLNAIQEFTELGSGFRIAAADLEIRGAGNLLGKQQSGNIAAVGLDLYLQMVEQAVQELKGQEITEAVEPILHLQVSAFIPEEYIEEAHQRLSLYKRLSACERIGELALLYGETLDRYGPLPEPVERLYEVMQIKVLAKSLQLESVEVRGRVVAVTFHEAAKIPESGIHWLMDYCQERIVFSSPRAFQIDTPQDDWSSTYAELNKILQALCRSRTTDSEAPPSPC